MPRTWPVVKREFGETVRSRMFIIGTLFGPLLMVGMMALQFVMMHTGGGVKALVIVDATGGQLGQRVAAALRRSEPGDEDRTRFIVELEPIGSRNPAALRQDVLARTNPKSPVQIDGMLWLPSDVMSGGAALYEGRSATNIAVMVQVRSALQNAVQSIRLEQQGIDPLRLATALKPVQFESRKAAGGSAEGSGEALFVLGYAMGFAIYFVVLIFGMAVMRGVLEEKKDRIVEVVVSSIRAQDLMLGKVLGIGGASLLQVGVWAGFTALALTFGGGLLARLGAPGAQMPHVPGSVAVVFLAYFAGGFLLYAGLYAALGAMAASDQDLQQLQMPATMLLLLSFFVMFRAMMDPEGGVARVASWVPFSAPMVMPIRAALSPVPLWDLAGSFTTLVLSALLIIWVGAKIYRVAILATGKKPSLAELGRWVRAA